MPETGYDIYIYIEQSDEEITPNISEDIFSKICEYLEQIFHEYAISEYSQLSRSHRNGFVVY